VKRRALIAAGLALSLLACDRWDPLPKPAAAPSTPSSWEVRFSPKGGCTEAVVDALHAAKSTVLVQAYSFTSAPIAAALVDAHRRGVKVQVILDKSQRTEKYSSADFVAHAGIRTLIDDTHAIAHNKVMVIDSGTILTGSFNFTRAAEEKNAENLLVIQDAALAEKYAANWRAHAQHSDLYAGRGTESGTPLLKPLPDGADDK